MTFLRSLSWILTAVVVTDYGPFCFAQSKTDDAPTTAVREEAGRSPRPTLLDDRLIDVEGGRRRESIRSRGETLIAQVAPVANEKRTTTFKIKLDRGADIGQNFGSLFEVTSEDGSLVIGAGFQNLYNSFYRGDRHAVQFFVRPTSGNRTFHVETLPRPNDLCGTYLFCRDDIVFSTYGGLKAWDAAGKVWRSKPDSGGTRESMRVGQGVLEFGDSLVQYNGQTILDKFSQGNYQLFFYAHGHLCFYHVNRGDGGYRPYENDANGFSNLYACSWTTDQTAVDLSKAIVLTLPVVGETTFAWGQLAGQIVTGSNIGGFYIFEGGKWRILLEPNIKVSYQLYSTMAFHDRLLMGQYPTGRVFEYDGNSIVDRAGWPPVLAGVSSSAREAQTTVIYGGEMLVGVWPWGEVWRYNSDGNVWTFIQRMFSHPELSNAIVHPYDKENRKHSVPNLWGQRVTSMFTSGDALYVATSAKYPCEWDPQQFPFLAPDKWKSYGSVYRLTSPGHLGANTAWTNVPTTLELTLDGSEMTISQDGKQLATTTITGPLADKLSHGRRGLGPIKWGAGIYGKFTGPQIEGSVRN